LAKSCKGEEVEQENMGHLKETEGGGGRMGAAADDGNSVMQLERRLICSHKLDNDHCPFVFFRWN
jgi:hypothetical protein